MKTPPPKQGLLSLGQMLLRIEDPRDSIKIHYPVDEIFFLLITGSLCGCNELTEMEVFGEQKLEWLRRYYSYANGIPSHDTLGRVLGLVNKKGFESIFAEWVSKHFDLAQGELVNFDGKRLNSSADRADQSKSRSEGGRYAEIIVNVFATGAGIVLAQSNVSEKMNEVQGAMDLLEALDLQGCCISADSNFCGRHVITAIINKKADYVLALKGKSPHLFDAARQAMADASIEKTSFSTEEKGHGRYERRQYRAIAAASLPSNVTQSYDGLRQIVEVSRYRKVLRTGKQQQETHYYITSLDKPVQDLASKIRAHWHIENKLHYVLDVTFEEDHSRLRTNNAASNQSLVRKIALNLLKQSKQKGSLKSQRLRCALSDDHRDKLLKYLMR